MTKIPVVDFSDLEYLKPGTSSWHSVRKQVCNALEEFGCFTATLSDKFTLELHNTFFDAAYYLYDSPDEIKLQNKYEKWPFCGQFKAGDAYEGLGIYDPTNPEEAHKFAHLFWADGNDQFCDAVQLYANMLKELDQVVTRMVFENYGVEKYHDGHIDTSIYCLQFEKQLDSKDHTDKNFSTIAHQNHAKGLEISTKDGKWIRFDPHLVPPSFLFMATDVFQVWSNDRIRSCRQRVHLNDPDQVSYSFGLYKFMEGVTTIPEELVEKDHPLKYNSLDQTKYLRTLKVDEGQEFKEINIKTFCGI